MIMHLFSGLNSVLATLHVYMLAITQNLFFNLCNNVLLGLCWAWKKQFLGLDEKALNFVLPKVYEPWYNPIQSSLNVLSLLFLADLQAAV